MLQAVTKCVSYNLSLALLVVQIVEGVVHVLVLAVVLVAPPPRLLKRVLQLRGPAVEVNYEARCDLIWRSCLPGGLEAIGVLGDGDLGEEPGALLLAKGGDAVLLAHLEELLPVEGAALLLHPLAELLLLQPVPGVQFNSINQP